MRILDFLRRDAIIAALDATTKEAVLVEMVRPITRANPTIDQTELVGTLIEREKLGSTGIGGGIAIPHGKLDGLERLEASFAKSRRGVDFNSMDGKPAHLFFLIVAPRNSAAEHLKALARVSRVFKDPVLKDRLRNADSSDEIYRILEESDLRMP
jgi:nitrogen PTS system EIIA component